MDALELVRRRARARRASAVAQAATTRGWELVRASARQDGYDLFPLKPDDALLAGAEAVLDRGIEAIFYNGEASEAEAAAYVAHELGHLDLHEGTAACGPEEIDASSADEPTPAGVHRVEAYGARERQEQQANVYARELLLPRVETRRLFLDERRKAEGVASDYRLPLDIVRQQLCDSLLTPAPPEAEEAAAAETGPLELDPSQRAAAEHAGSPLLLEAGPGTGKTRTLIARIVHLIENGADPASILALTFSNKAAREITDRVAVSLPRQAPVIWTGTFHAFGLEILRKHHPLVGLESEIKIFDRSDAIELLEEMLPALGLEHHTNLYEPALELKEMLAGISRAKDEMVDAAGYKSLAEAMRRDARDPEQRIAAQKALEVAKVYDVYQRTLEWKKAVDFGDLIMRTTLLLESHDAVRDSVRLRHRHVLVDEYQDVNRASARLLQAIAGDGRRLWVVGDSRQSIYRFRGASASNMALFAEDFPGAERRALAINYRSAREVVDTLRRFVPGMKVSRHALPQDLRSHRGEAGGAPTVRVVPDRDSEVSAVAASVLKLAARGVPLSEQAVLCRSNAKVSAFSAGLEARGVPVLHLGSLFERDEVRDMLSLLWLLTDPRGGALMRVAAFPAYAVPIDDVRAYLAAVREADFTAVEGLAQLKKIEGLSEEARAGLERLGRDLSDIDRKSTPWQIFARYLFDSSSYLLDLLGGDPKQLMKAVALYQFLNFVRHARTVGRGFPATRMLNKVRRLVLLAEERDLRQIPATALHLDAVRLMTIHGAKGLEFEAVHIPSLTTASLPSNFRPPRCPPPTGMVRRGVADGEDPLRDSHDAEEECLFFVALSRARAHLQLYRSRTAGSVRRRASKFLGRLDLAGAGPVDILPVTAPDNDDVLQLAGPRPTATDGRDLQTYERCPRRYFYARIFGLAGTWRDSAFDKTHRAIYEVLDWLKEKPSGDFPAETEALAQLEESWRRTGPTGHAFEPQYRSLAETIVGHLIEAHQGSTLTDAEPLEVELPDGTVIVEPDLWATLPDGRTLLRILRTGRKGSFRGNDTLFGLYEAGARLRYGSDGFELEVLHLTDNKRTSINMSLEKIMTRCERSASYLGAMAEGRYPPRVDQVRCPRCPYFFCCPTVPEGVLRLDRGEE